METYRDWEGAPGQAEMRGRMGQQEKEGSRVGRGEPREACCGYGSWKPCPDTKSGDDRQWSLVDDREQLSPPHLLSSQWEEKDEGLADRDSTLQT